MRQHAAATMMGSGCLTRMAQQDALFAFCLHMAQTSRTIHVRNVFMQFAGDRLACANSARIEDNISRIVPAEGMTMRAQITFRNGAKEHARP